MWQGFAVIAHHGSIVTDDYAMTIWDSGDILEVVWLLIVTMSTMAIIFASGQFSLMRFAASGWYMYVTENSPFSRESSVQPLNWLAYHSGLCWLNKSLFSQTSYFVGQTSNCCWSNSHFFDQTSDLFYDLWGGGETQKKKYAAGAFFPTHSPFKASE